MKVRIDAGSDIAMIGAWDAGRNDSVLTNATGKTLDEALEQDSTAGDVFVIHLGGDGGGPIDVYVDSPIPKEALTEMRVTEREFLLRVPSGRLIVGGVEDYRSGGSKATGPGSIVVLPPGDYALRCYVGPNEGNFAPPTSKELRAALGEDDYTYYSRIAKVRLLGYAIVLLFPALTFFLDWNWKWALLTTIAVFLGFFYGQEELVVKRNARYQRICRKVNQLFRKAKAKEGPCFILELRRIAAAPLNVTGGSIRADAA
jgi:hypothetical protein